MCSGEHHDALSLSFKFKALEGLNLLVPFLPIRIIHFFFILFMFEIWVALLIWRIWLFFLEYEPLSFWLVPNVIDFAGHVVWAHNYLIETWKCWNDRVSVFRTFILVKIFGIIVAIREWRLFNIGMKVQKSYVLFYNNSPCNNYWVLHLLRVKMLPIPSPGNAPRTESFTNEPAVLLKSGLY